MIVLNYCNTVTIIDKLMTNRGSRANNIAIFLSVLATCKSCSPHSNKVTTCWCSVQVHVLVGCSLATKAFIGVGKAGHHGVG